MSKILLSFGLITLCSAGTWTDDGVYSFEHHEGSDEGWKIYPDGMKNTDACNVDTICAVNDPPHHFYGPFPPSGTTSKKNWLERRVECAATSTVTVSYKVLSCGATKGNSIPWVDSFEGNPTAISTTNVVGPLIVQCDVNASPPTQWITSTVPQSVSYTPPTTYIGGDRFTVKIKNSIKNTGKNWIYDISITCNPTGDTATAPPDSPPPTHQEYCIDGFDVASRDTYNGEYVMSHDAFGYNVVLFKVNNIGTHSFEKHDHRGDAFLYQLYETVGTSSGYRWHIGPTLGATTGYVWQCPTTEDAYTIHTNTQTICNGITSSTSENSETITMLEGECVDRHTSISDVIMGVLNIDLTRNEMETIAILATLVLFSCILGMITCYCCQLICGRIKNRKYNKVSNKDLEDIDF